jgi:Tol biopolymer transport system component
VFAAVALLLLAIGIAGILLSGGLGQFSGPPAVSGRAIIPEPRGAVAYDLSNKAERVLLKAPPDGWVGAVDVSKDGKRTVAQLFLPPQGRGIGTSQLVVLEADGSQRILLEPQPGEFLGEPRWSPDGASVYFTRRLTRKPQPGEPQQRVERVSAAGGDRVVLLDNASWPSPTPDGSALALLREDQGRVGLSVLPLGGGAPRELVPPSDISGLLSPAVSPDGRQIAFSMIVPASAASPPADPLAALGHWLVPTALAHGVPYDVYLVPLDGSAAPRRLTNINQDSPFIAWSPDGAHLLLRAEYNMFLADARSGASWQLNENGGYGTIAWAPPG